MESNSEIKKASWTSEQKERYLKRYLEEFKKLRNDYIEDIPRDRLLPGDPHYLEYKCRGHWFIGIQGGLCAWLDHNVLEDPLDVKKANEFLEFLEELDKRAFTEEGRVTKEDIQKGNETLDYFLNKYSA